MKVFTALFLLGSILLFLPACEEESGTGLADVELQFNALFDTEPLVMLDETYSYEADMDMKLQLFQFYISDVQLIKSGTAQAGQELIDIELVSFGEVFSRADAEQGLSFQVADVPTGTYEGIRFGIGVSSDLNQTQPGDYTPPHPLDGHYWSWATGYVFTKVEGIADLDQDGVFEEKLTFHIGKDENYRTVTFNQAIEIRDNSEIDFTVDLRRVLVDAQGEFLDFRQTSVDHTNDPAIGIFLMDNLVQAIELEKK
jgi:hypothetical protein